ncbi:MAG: SRPBCC family protein [Pseudomonadales bacterium]
MKFEKAYQLPYPVEATFSAWVSPDAVVAPVTSIEVDPRVGGVFRLIVGSGANNSLMDGKILEFERNQRIRYTWFWGGEESASIVDVMFSEANGETQLRITHSEIETQESVSMYARGWDDYIAGLSTHLNRT